MSLRKCIKRHRQDKTGKREARSEPESDKWRALESAGRSAGTKNFVLSLDKNME